MPSTSLAVLYLRDSLGVPSTRISIDGSTFVSYVLPPLVCYFVAAVFAVTPQTRTARVALWPLTALLALRAALSVDLSLGQTGLKFSNANFVLSMFSIAVRSLGWTLAKGPLVRYLRPSNGSPSTIMDAFDLAVSFRGHGWDWSHSQSFIPRETRPKNRTAFIFHTCLSAVVHTLAWSAFYRAVLALVPEGVGSIPERSTIFDDTLPFLVRYLRASLISTFTATWLYAAFQMGYDLCTILAILILGHDPAQWPPAFDAPWRATSLSDFWGRRWQQFFRHIFLLLGYPVSFLLGRAGVVIGAFLASAVLHYISLVTLTSEIEFWWMFVGFGMMAIGILAEQAFRWLTGRRVGGALGWVWTMTWLLVWGNVIVEGFARGGMFVCSSLFDSASPVRAPVERVMIGFDAWLHTLNKERQPLL